MKSVLRSTRSSATLICGSSVAYCALRSRNRIMMLSRRAEASIARLPGVRDGPKEVAYPFAHVVDTFVSQAGRGRQPEPPRRGIYAMGESAAALGEWRLRMDRRKKGRVPIP